MCRNYNNQIIAILPFLLIIYLFSFPVLLFPLNPAKQITQYSYSNWQIENGLPQNTVLSIVQMKSRCLWFGTEEGLVWFDGKTFNTYNKNNTKWLKQNFIWSLYTDSNDNLWIGTRGAGIVKFKNGIYKQYTLKDGLSNNFVLYIYEDSKDNIWIGTRGGGLNRLTDNVFTCFTSKDGLGNDFPFTIIEDDQSRLWIGSYGGGLSKYENGTFKTYNKKDGLLSNTVLSLATKQDVIFIGTSEGLMKYIDDSFIQLKRSNTAENDSIRSLLVDSKNSLWCGTLNNGLLRYQKNKFEAFTMDDGLSSNRILSLKEDIEGNLWVGTWGGGLIRFTDGKFSIYGKTESILSDNIASVMVDNRGRIWIGTAGSGLNVIDNNSIKSYTIKNGLSSNEIRGMMEDRAGRIWIGSANKGITIIDNNKFTYLTKKDGLSSNNVLSILEDSLGNVWIGTATNGVNKLTNNNITIYNTENGFINNFVSFIHEDEHGNIWIGTNGGGLSRWKNGNFTFYKEKDGLSSNMLYSIFEDKEGNLWFGSLGGGLIKYRNGKFVSFTSKHGLYSDYISYITEDNDGNLWMTCNKGIFKVDIRDLGLIEKEKLEKIDCIVYDVFDGMRTPECNGGAWPSGDVKVNDMGEIEYIYFPTIKGLHYIDPDNINNNNVEPIPRIIEVLFNDLKVDKEKKQHFEYDRNNFTFKYTTCSYTYPENIRFEYKLEGYDKEWVSAYDRRTAYYTSLQPGEYRFRVVAYNNDGVKSKTEDNFVFVIKPLFFQTTLFIILIGIMILMISFFITYIFMRRRQRRLKLQQVVLKNMVDERTKELNEKNEQLKCSLEEVRKAQDRANSVQKELLETIHYAAVGETAGRTAHEILNPLTIISGKVEVFRNYVDDLLKPSINLLDDIVDGWQKEYDEGGVEKLINSLKELVDENENTCFAEDDLKNLKEVLKQLVELKDKTYSDNNIIQYEIDDIFVKLDKMKELTAYKSNKSDYSIKNLIFEVKNVFINTFTKEKIAFEYFENVENVNLHIDRNEFYMLFTNLMKNSIEAIRDKDSEDKGLIRVEVLKGTLEVNIKFIDNGKGIEEKDKPYIFEPGYTTKLDEKNTGFGLSISRRFLRGYGGDIRLLKTSLEEGTVFVISMPILPSK